MAGKALTVTRNAGRLFRFGSMLYNGGMFPFQCINALMQAPFMALDVCMIGEVYIPSANAKWWNIGNVTDDTKTIAKLVIEKN